MEEESSRVSGKIWRERDREREREREAAWLALRVAFVI